MKLLVRTLEDVTILELEGQLALEGSTTFRKQFSAEMEAGARKLIVNLARVNYIDSMGLGELISCHSKLRQVDGQMKLVNLSSRLRYLLAITRLNTVFEVFDSEAAAIASYTQARRD